MNLDDLVLEGDNSMESNEAVNVDEIPPDGGIDPDDFILMSGENDAVPSVTLNSMKDFSALDLSELSPELQSALNAAMSVPL